MAGGAGGSAVAPFGLLGGRGGVGFRVTAQGHGPSRPLLIKREPAPRLPPHCHASPAMMIME